ncbi:MAG: hypothetical protein ASARMPREDX12_005792 [Alectoria sarmentosa]|nr:MAG: hypothetical protein ASARMPREDX12_005792 [Alectoria sarmentosa]
MSAQLKVAIVEGSSTRISQTPYPYLLNPTNILPIFGGPGDLVLASLCQRKNLPYTVLEADDSEHARTQGGSLDIHANSGQLALKEAGLLDAFMCNSRIEGEAIKLLSLEGNVLFDRAGIDRGKPEIDRTKLRGMLLGSLDPTHIKWGCKVTKVESTHELGYYDIHFANREILKGYNLVVGADGAWSKVRPLVSDMKPFYSDICGLDIWTHDVDNRKPHLAALIGQGAFFGFGDGHALLGQRSGDGTIRVYALVSRFESWSQECSIDWRDIRAANEELARTLFRKWGDVPKAMLLDTDDDATLRQLYMLPIGFQWDSRPGVTLLGDVAHLMKPFAGVGVNILLTDALELAQAVESVVVRGQSRNDLNQVCCDMKTLTDVLQDYEKKMFVRAKEAATETYGSLQVLFAENAEEQMVGIMKTMGAEDG